MILKTFGWSFAITVLGLAAAFLYGYERDGSSAGISALTIAAILIVLEVSLSFDNAVVNAKVLGPVLIDCLAGRRAVSTDRAEGLVLDGLGNAVT